jgi:hypothetical protein
MQESFTSEHSSKLFRDSLEDLLDCSGVAHKGGSHGEATRRDVTDSSLNIVRDPFHEVGAVLVLDIQHLFINFLH